MMSVFTRSAYSYLFCTVLIVSASASLGRTASGEEGFSDHPSHAVKAEAPRNERLQKFLTTVQSHLPKVCTPAFEELFTQEVSKVQKRLPAGVLQQILALETRYFEEFYLPCTSTPFVDATQKKLLEVFRCLVGMETQRPAHQPGLVSQFAYDSLKTYFPSSGLKKKPLYFLLFCSKQLEKSQFDREKADAAIKSYIPYMQSYQVFQETAKANFLASQESHKPLATPSTSTKRGVRTLEEAEGRDQPSTSGNSWKRRSSASSAEGESLLLLDQGNNDVFS